MLTTVLKQARALPDVVSYFCGMEPPEGFVLPPNLLLYCHDFSWPKTTTSSRYMLTIPLVELTYEVEGKQIPLQPGQALLVSPHLLRSVPDCHETYLRLIISFEAPVDQDYLAIPRVSSLPEAAWPLIDLLLKYYLRKDMAQALLTLTLLLYELSPRDEREKQQKLSPLVRHSLHLINQCLEKTFTIQAIAAEADVSISHLRRTFREEIGVSLGEYMARHRVDAARHLLLETSQPIATVAKSCGYDTVFSFSRFFKSRTGLSPSGFRKQPPAEY